VAADPFDAGRFDFCLGTGVLEGAGATVKADEHLAINGFAAVDDDRRAASLAVEFRGHRGYDRQEKYGDTTRNGAGA
jgi:hypothetical protein